LPITIQFFFALITGLTIFGIFGFEYHDQNITSTERLPDNGESTISKIAEEEPLLFGLFTFANDTESLDVMRHHYYSSNNLNHYIMHSIRSLSEGLWLYDTFPMHRKMIVIQSLDNITDATIIGQDYELNMILYDIEQWERTPESERTNPALSISKGAGIVHEAGYRYGIAPDAPTLIDNYKKINWTDIDFLNMQLQRFSQDVTQYSRLAEEITTFVRSKNPNIEIFTQLSFRFTDAEGMINVIENVKDIVDGFIIFYERDTGSDSCISECSPHELNMVLNGINWRQYLFENGK
jgi:hypothetical protein